MPVYLVTSPGNPPTEKLVEAANMASARGHVARQVITAKVATGAELFRIAKAGGDIEQVREVVEPDATADATIHGSVTGQETTSAKPNAEDAEAVAADGVERKVGEPRRTK